LGLNHGTGNRFFSPPSHVDWLGGPPSFLFCPDLLWGPPSFVFCPDFLGGPLSFLFCPDLLGGPPRFPFCPDLLGGPFSFIFCPDPLWDPPSFLFCPDLIGAHPVSYSVQTCLGPTLFPIQWVPWIFPRCKMAGHDVSHSLHLVSSLRMSGAIMPLPHMPSWHRQGQLHRYFIC
jgi:hypothetical protein